MGFSGKPEVKIHAILEMPEGTPLMRKQINDNRLPSVGLLFGESNMNTSKFMYTSNSLGS